MDARITRFTDAHNRIQQSDQRIIQSLLKHKQTLWIKDISDVVVAQHEYEAEEFKVSLPLEIFSGERHKIHGILDQLDDDFRAWENAIKENTGKGLDAFLDATDPITNDMRSHLKTLVTTRKEQINQGLHLLPPGLDEPCQMLQQKNIKIGAMLEKIPALLPGENQQAYHVLWEHRNLYQRKKTANLKVKMEFLETCAKENLEKTIADYQSQVLLLFKTYNELADIAEGVEVPLQSLTQTAAISVLQENRQIQRAAALPSLDNKSAEDVNAASLISLLEAERNSLARSGSVGVSDSPPSSSHCTPPSDSELSLSSGRSSEDETRSLFGSFSEVSITEDDAKKILPEQRMVGASSLLTKSPATSAVANQGRPVIIATPASQPTPPPLKANQDISKGLLAKLGINKPASQPATSTGDARLNNSKITSLSNMR